ncbi:MAG: hypothetical protein QOH17_538 [Pseudonocardiales bacterium]|nr:hypothetical protein [Pseudonocardiales bacterium]
MGENGDRRPDPSLIDERQELRADCSRCQGLCCVAPAFARSADFAIDKPAGRACLKLGSDLRCSIHANLREQGFRGCTVFDCFGAGQHVVQASFAGQDWRQGPKTAASMFTVFNVMRHLKETLWYLAEALAALPAGPLRTEVDRARARTHGLIDAPAADLEQLDLAAHRAEVAPLLARVSATLRAEVPRRGRDRVDADLMGATLRGADLRGISLRGAYLIGADLRAADLSRTDLLGADLRGADLRGARLRTSLFLTQPQLDAATGNSGTSVPAWLTHPRHWSISPTSPPRPRPGRRRQSVSRSS